MDYPTVLIIAPPGAARDSFVADLRSSGCNVETAASGFAGEQTAAAAHPDVVVLPNSLPDADSLVLCQRIRSATDPSRRPIFLVTPDSEDPYAESGSSRRFDQLAVGINAMLRWQEGSRQRMEPEHAGALTIDIDRHRVLLDGQEVKLTPTEFRILAMLARDPERVYSRRQLGEACHADGVAPQDRTIDVHIKSIRQKLNGHGKIIDTVHGIGYRVKQPVRVQ